MIDRKGRKELAEDKLVRNHTQELVPVLVLAVLVGRSLRQSRVRRRLERRSHCTRDNNNNSSSSNAWPAPRLHLCQTLPALAFTPIPTMMGLARPAS